MKKLILTALLVALSVFAYTQDFYVESNHVGFEEDLTDQKQGTIQKMYFYLDEMYIDYLAKDPSLDVDVDTRLIINDMRKTVDDEGMLRYVFKVSFIDGEVLGKLEIALMEDGSQLFAGCLEGLYFTGKYKKKVR